MPVFITENLVQSLYKIQQGQNEEGRQHNPVLPINYGRKYFEGSEQFFDRREALVGVGVDVTHGPLLVVGCGFGYLMEELILSGRESYGIEPGNFFWSKMREEANPDIARLIVDDWMGSADYITSLQTLTSERFGFVIDEDAAPAHSDVELRDFYASLEAVHTNAPLPYNYATGIRRGSRVIHFVTALDKSRGPGDSSQNWKTAEQWKQTAPDHVWLSASDGSVL